MKFSDTLHITFLHVKENDLRTNFVMSNDLRTNFIMSNDLRINFVMPNDLRINFAKAVEYLVYVPEPLCALSIFYEFSVNYA